MWIYTPSPLGGDEMGASRRRNTVPLWKQLSKKKICYGFILPTFILLLIFNYYPAFAALYRSFFYWDPWGSPSWDGLDNFRMLMDDPEFWTSMKNMLFLTICQVGITLTTPLIAALLIFHLRSHRSGYAFRVLFVAPMVVPTMVVLLIWRFIYSPEIGLLNTLLRRLGLDFLTRTWLGDFDLALPAVVFAGFPWVSGFSLLIYLAGLQNIPEQVIEAARIDGASNWQMLFRIELPLIVPQMKLLTILAIISAMQETVKVMILTNGGPGNATLVPGLYLYKQAFMYSQLGYGSAIGTVLFCLMLVVTYLNLKYIQASTEYEAT